jgi:hypothetical protein
LLILWSEHVGRDTFGTGVYHIRDLMIFCIVALVEKKVNISYGLKEPWELWPQAIPQILHFYCMDWYKTTNYLLPLWQNCEDSHVSNYCNLHIQNFVLLESTTPVRLLATLGYNASVGIDSVVEFPRFMVLLWVSHEDFVLLHPFLLGYTRTI